MPYISQERREQLLNEESSVLISNAGDFNYIISAMINDFINYKGKSYAVINEVIGALECAKLELYRRIASPYEDTKILQNGDVYTL